MSRRRPLERPTYQRSGRVAWLRFLPLAVLALGVAAGMAYVWFLAYDAGWGYWLATPVVLSLPVALAGFLAVAIGRCRNRTVAAILGGLATLVFHGGYFHADLVRRAGPDALTRFDLLPAFIAERMATDGIAAGREILPRSEMLNWSYSGFELLMLGLVIGGLTVYRSLSGYCESCGRWMRSIAMRAEPGTSRDVADALEDGDFGDLPVLVGTQPFRQTSAWLEFEYCPGVQQPDNDCAAYLTLKEFRKGNERPETLLYQGRLTADELDVLTGRVAALAFLRVSAPTTADEPGPGRAIARHAGPVAAVERLPADAGSADLDRGGVSEFLLSLIPLLTLLAGVGLIVWGSIRAPWAEPPVDWVGYLMLAAGFVLGLIGGVVCWMNIDFLSMQYALARLRRRVAQRPDTLVPADDPDAWFVDVVPRAQWHQLFPDKAADRGLVRLDPAAGRVVFEGLKERYVLPADAVLSCEVEAMLPHTGNWNLYAVVLTVRYPADAPASVTGGRRDDEWEVPLVPRPMRFRRYNSAYRRAMARELRAEIDDLVDDVRGRTSPP